MTTVVSVGYGDSDGKRIAACWKCTHGLVLTEKHVVLCLASESKVVTVNDFFNPPGTCTLWPMWRDQDAKAQAADR